MESFSQPAAVQEPATTEDFTEDIKLPTETQPVEKQLPITPKEEPSQDETTEETTMDTADTTPAPAPPAEVKPVDVKCSLCHCRLESLLCARDHYEGRRHQKNFMAAVKAKHELYTSIAAGQKPINIPKLTKKTSGEGHPSSAEGADSHVAENPEKTNKEEQDGEHDGVLMYCFVCDIQVNSNDQALQHYTGRKHRYKSSLMTSLPKASETNEPNLKRKSQVLVSSEQQKADGENKPPVVKKSGGPKAAPKPVQKLKSATPQQTFSCTLCAVHVTSQDMLDAHLAGSKHRKTMARLGASITIPKKIPVNAAVVTTPIGNGGRNSKAARKVNATRNVSTSNTNPGTPPAVIYITCNVCSVTMNSQKQYEQHLVSQKHKHKLNSPGGNPVQQQQHKKKATFGYGGMGGNQRKGARKFQQYTNKKFVKGGGGAPASHQNWSRIPVNQVQADSQDWSNPGWPQLGMMQGATSSMANTAEYHTTESYAYPYEPARTAPHAGPRFSRPDLKAKSPNTYGQPPPYMTYTEDSYHSV